MAVEVAEQFYYNHQYDCLDVDALPGALTTETFNCPIAKDRPNAEDHPQAEGVFEANYVHDLESIWWILVWTWLNFDKKGTVLSPYQSKRRSQITSELFPGKVESLPRLRFLYTEKVFTKYNKNIPGTLPALREIISTLRPEFSKIYAVMKEKGINRELDGHYTGLLDEPKFHKQFLDVLRSALKGNIDIDVVMTDSIPTTTVTAASSNCDSNVGSKRSFYKENVEERPKKKARYSSTTLNFISLWLIPFQIFRSVGCSRGFGCNFTR